MTLWQIALALFLVANPIGNVPALVALVKDFDFCTQRKILFREAVFAFFIAFIFLFIGEPFLKILYINQYAVSICGGMLLFIIALKMIFPPPENAAGTSPIKEPFIVPIATPLISGGGVLSTIMIYSNQVRNNFKMTLALILAWVGITCVMVSAAYLQKLLGRRGLLAMEQLTGMLLALLSMQLIVTGTNEFIQILFPN